MSEHGKREIDPTFSLARYADFRDYYSESDETRVLSGPIDNKQVTLHNKLQTEGVLVLPLATDETQAYYTVPEGIQPLESLGIAIRRNIRGYAEVFRNSGRLIRKLMDVGLEVDLSSSSFAAKTAIYFMDQGKISGDLILTPPYELYESVRPPDEVIEDIAQSLTDSFEAPEDIGSIKQEIEGGFYEIG